MSHRERKTRKKTKKKQISPRLLKGGWREPLYHGLPPEVKHGLTAIAKAERKSTAWIIEEAILDYFGLKNPGYKIPKTWKKG
jgi:hypothetical protein